MRLWPVAFSALLVLPVVTAGADEPKPSAAAAAREKKDKKPADKPAKVYTDEDLKNAGKNGGGAVTFLAEPDPATAEPEGHSSESGASAESGTSTESGSSSEGRRAASEDGGTGEQGWRDRAAEFRANIRTAQAEISRLEAKLNALTNPQRQPQPIEALQPDPQRRLTKDDDRIELEKSLEEARNTLAEAQRALEAFLEDARKHNVPPGWVEER